MSNPTASSEPPSRKTHLFRALIFNPFEFAARLVGAALGHGDPSRSVALGYVAYTIVGWALLSLPVSHEHPVSSLDSLFIASSAMSTTGLATVDVASTYSWFGEAVILLLIQAGGIGYMTFGSFVVLAVTHRISEFRASVSGAAFSLPVGFDLPLFLRGVVIYTFSVEAIGAVLLALLFSARGVEAPVWQGVFHSVSSFCTAGFSLFPTGLMAFRDDVAVNFVVSALAYLGAIGFIVTLDVFRRMKGEIGGVTITTRIILRVTFLLAVCGTVLVFLHEPSIATLAPESRLLAAHFQVMSAMTTVGFNTVDVSVVSHPTVLVLLTLMVIGASPSGTGGGLKSTTFTALLAVLKANLRGEAEVRFWGRAVPTFRVRHAVSAATLYIVLLTVGTYLLTLTESQELEPLVFEAASALGTVGLSLGITSSLTALGKLTLVALMVIGRIGPLTLSFALFAAPSTPPADSDLAV